MWLAFKYTFILFCLVGGTAVLLYCLAVIIGTCVEAQQSRAMRRRRLLGYRVGEVCSPEITRAWLAAMRENQK